MIREPAGPWCLSYRAAPVHPMNIHTVYRAFARRFRTERMRLFVETLGVTAETRILDIGGDLFNWGLVDFAPRITILNLEEAPDGLPANVEWLVGDARALPVADHSFDVCYSNSVIEHMYTWTGQQQFAAELRRAAPAYFVQTPSRSFPVEPHYLTPFIHWVPDHRRARLLRHLTVWGWMTKPTLEDSRAMVDEIRLVTRAEMRALFPDAEIEEERVAGLTKSLLAIRTG